VSKRVVTSQKPVGDWDLPAPSDAKFLTKYVAVRFRRARRDPESLANFLI
jgi:hypothetical protein